MKRETGEEERELNFYQHLYILLHLFFSSRAILWMKEAGERGSKKQKQDRVSRKKAKGGIKFPFFFPSPAKLY